MLLAAMHPCSAAAHAGHAQRWTLCAISARRGSSVVASSLRPAYDDEWFSVIAKPSNFDDADLGDAVTCPGLLSRPQQQALSATGPSMQTPFGADDALSDPSVLHTCDREIASLVVVAKSRAAKRYLQRQLPSAKSVYHAMLACNAWAAGAAAADEDESTRKAFDAAVEASARGGDVARLEAGAWRWAWRRWDNEAHPTKKGARRVLDLNSLVDGVETECHFEVLSVREHPLFGEVSHVRVTPSSEHGTTRRASDEEEADALPHMGFMHALRLQSAALGCPVVGDALYWPVATAVREKLRLQPLGAPADAAGDGELHLAHIGLQLEHPVDGSAVHIMAPEPRAWATLRGEQPDGLQYEVRRRYELDKGFYRE